MPMTAVELLRLEKTLACEHADFMEKYLATTNLSSYARLTPEIIDRRTITTLAEVLEDPVVTSERQSLTLLREAAGGLTAVFTGHGNRELAELAFATLLSCLGRARGSTHQAITEALGSLPLNIGQGPCFPAAPCMAEVKEWQELFTASGVSTALPFAFAGRSLVAPIGRGDRLLVVKLAAENDTEAGLAREILWMEHIRKTSLHGDLPFHVPEPLRVGASPLFRYPPLPRGLISGRPLHPARFAIAYLTDRRYFDYPNDPAGNGLPDENHIVDILGLAAELFGRYTGRGIIHTAPIPLFHNRVQSQRRDDMGLYDWTLGGRLDQWLSSCRHPNFGGSGLRDFEHFEFFPSSGYSFYWHMGAQFLSLLLVAGSYFRAQAPEQIGTAPDGRPVDVRHLYDEPLLASLIDTVFKRYHLGFAGVPFQGRPPFDAGRLARRMIEEMGRDLHMEEVLRLVDQERMSDLEFREFLTSRGYTPKAAAALKRGRDNVVIFTGPHLGGFNQPISLPELVEAIATMAATCVVQRYRAERSN